MVYQCRKKRINAGKKLISRKKIRQLYTPEKKPDPKDEKREKPTKK